VTPRACCTARMSAWRNSSEAEIDARTAGTARQPAPGWLFFGHMAATPARHVARGCRGRGTRRSGPVDKRYTARSLLLSAVYF
jgi:hypothetical protein